jgi:2-C-methyl-D-erythritol 4-phosphate cytidylyltransferase
MTKIWVIIPAAGSGKRFNSNKPKQYHPLLDSTVLQQTIERFIQRDDIAGIVLAVAKGDVEAKLISKAYPSQKVLVTLGGKERSDSVRQAMAFLQDKAADEDLVAVHDAARPCVRQSDLDAVLQSAKANTAGALLVLPSFNTLKQVQGTKLSTLDRSQIYQALTPQVFRFDLLIKALDHAASNNIAITDDASAVELLGLSPALVIGHSDNIKITEAEDLALAAFYLQQQAKQNSQEQA